MNETIASALENGLEKYQAGEKAEELIPLFKDICDRAPKVSTAWSCLAWLYLLVDKPDRALKAAEKSVKLDPRSPQARVNLVLSMLDAGKAGVRQHIEIVQQMMALDSQIRNDVQENLKDGLEKKPNWQSLLRVQIWLSGN